MAFPVFDGLEESHVTGKELASIIGVTPPTISKWRTGRARVPAATLAFLTLLLASWLEELEELKRAHEATGRPAAWLDEHLEEARRCLKEQEEVNTELPAAAIIQGVKMFQSWWQANAQVLRRTALGREGTLRGVA
ncbi:MAG: helix-turn-helix domain-containing protein [Magnetospirillum sp. WYHS-4]